MNKMQGTSVALVNSAGEVLLCLRDDIPEIPFPGKWDLLGGHLEPGEEPLTCIRREISEELIDAVTGEPVRLAGPALFKRYDLADRVEWMHWERFDKPVDELILTERTRLERFSYERVAATPEGEFAFGFKPLLVEFFEARPFDRPPL